MVRALKEHCMLLGMSPELFLPVFSVAVMLPAHTSNGMNSKQLSFRSEKIHQFDPIGRTRDMARGLGGVSLSSHSHRGGPVRRPSIVGGGGSWRAVRESECYSLKLLIVPGSYEGRA